MKMGRVLASALNHAPCPKGSGGFKSVALGEPPGRAEIT